MSLLSRLFPPKRKTWTQDDIDAQLRRIASDWIANEPEQYAHGFHVGKSSYPFSGYEPEDLASTAFQVGWLDGYKLVHTEVFIENRTPCGLKGPFFIHDSQVKCQLTVGHPGKHRTAGWEWEFPI